MRSINPKELIHERLGERFASELSMYDTERRLTVLIDEFLGGMDLVERSALEVGAGLGFFSERLQLRGARVIATDIGEGLLQRVHQRVGCECIKVDALCLSQHFARESFDIVLSSECIEHTPSPEEALRQMARLVKCGGYLSMSTPNILWQPVVRAATALRLRPFDGLENFSSFAGIRRILHSENLEILQEKGLHLLPFQLRLNALLRWCDEHLQPCRNFMINLCVLARKRNH